jgi:hypothetical protein
LNTKITWIVPSFYVTNSQSDLEFDFLSNIKKIINNNILENKHSKCTNNTSKIKNIDPDNILKASVILPSFGECSLGLDTKNDNRFIYEIIKKYCNNKFNIFEDTIKKANLDCSRSISIITIEFDFDIKNIPKTLAYSDENFVSKYYECLSLIKEIGRIFYSATHLKYYSKFPIFTSLNLKKYKYGGLIYISSKNKYIYSIELISEFTYPIVFLKESLEDFINLLDILSNIWHLNLWPLERFIKAFNSENIDMENLLELIFSLEGLFDEKVSSDFIRYCCIVLTSGDKKEANKNRDILNRVYRIRNDIVHGKKIYNGFEEIKINGKKTLSQTLFFYLKPIVAKMILFAIEKINKNSKLKNLTINSDDMIEKIF